MTSPLLDSDGSIEDLSDRELLERIARFDPEEYPIVTFARRAIQQGVDQQHQEDSV